MNNNRSYDFFLLKQENLRLKEENSRLKHGLEDKRALYISAFAVILAALLAVCGYTGLYFFDVFMSEHVSVEILGFQYSYTFKTFETEVQEFATFIATIFVLGLTVLALWRKI